MPGDHDLARLRPVPAAGAHPGCSALSLLRRDVRVGGIALGTVADVILAPSLERAVGLEVACRDGLRRFAPWDTCSLAGDTVSVGSALALLGAGELSFYRSRGLALGSLQGLLAYAHGRAVGSVADVAIEPAGEVAALVLAGPGGSLRIDPLRAELDGGGLHAR